MQKSTTMVVPPESAALVVPVRIVLEDDAAELGTLRPGLVSST